MFDVLQVLRIFFGNCQSRRCVCFSGLMGSRDHFLSGLGIGFLLLGITTGQKEAQRAERYDT